MASEQDVQQPQPQPQQQQQQQQQQPVEQQQQQQQQQQEPVEHIICCTCGLCFCHAGKLKETW